MPYEYLNETDASDPHKLPSIEIIQLTAAEAAVLDHDTVLQYMRRHEYRLAHMNGTVREKMIDAIIAEEDIKGGYFWQTCFPGCMPDSEPIGPFDSYAEALADAREGQD